MTDEQPTDPFSKHVKASGSDLPPLQPGSPPPAPKPERRGSVTQGLLVLSLALNVAALGLIAVLVAQPSTLGLAKDSRVTTVERKVEAAPGLAEVRAQVAQIRRGPQGVRGPRGALGPPGPEGTVEGYDLDDFESRISDLEASDPDSRISDLESFRSGLCDAFLAANPPVDDLYYFGPC